VPDGGSGGFRRIAELELGTNIRFNDWCERWGPAATDARIVADLNGWPPSAPHLGWAASSRLTSWRPQA
jgi:hypothetical protein